MLVSSYEQLINIVREFKRPDGCWCSKSLFNEGFKYEHAKECRELQRLFK